MSEIRVAHIAGLFIGKGIATLATLAATAIVARLVGPEGLGRWSLLLAAAALLHSVLINWTHGPLLRYGAEEWVTRGSVGRTLAARLPLLAVSAAAAAALLVLQPGDWLRTLFAARGDDWMLVALLTFSTWLTAEAQALLQATNRLRSLAVLAPAVGVASVAGLVLLGAFGTPSLAAVAIVVSAASVAGWGAVWLGAIGSVVSGDVSVRRDAMTRQLRYGLPIMPNFVLGYVSSWGLHILLNRGASIGEVGVFALAYQTMLAVMAANGVVTMVLLPRVIAHELRAPGFLRRYVAVEVPALFTLWMFAVVWLVALLPNLLAVVAAGRFDEAITILLILMSGLPSSVAASLYKIPFSVQERMAAVVFYSGLMACACVSAAALLIPRFGAAGAAVAAVASFAVVQACYVADQHRRLELPASLAWSLWSGGLLLGATQALVGPALVLRLVWAAGATAVLVVVARRVGCVDARMLERAFNGRFHPVAVALNRVLVART
jgi:O-antigen/teichoic acid export membrane protein